MKHKDRPSNKTHRCPECAKTMLARGIGGHLHKVHGIRGGIRALLNNKYGVKLMDDNVEQSVKQGVKRRR